jgi:hypothetical protein
VLTWDFGHNRWAYIDAVTGKVTLVLNPNPANTFTADDIMAVNPAENADQTGGINYLTNPLPGIFSAVRYGFDETGGGIQLTEEIFITPETVASGDGWPAAAPWIGNFVLTQSLENGSGLYYGQSGSTPI